jgi:hypothetical protein
VAHVRVAEDHVVDLELTDQPGELGLVVDLDPVGVPVAGQARRIHAFVDERDLRGRERDDLVAPVAAVGDVEYEARGSG